MACVRQNLPQQTSLEDLNSKKRSFGQSINPPQDNWVAHLWSFSVKYDQGMTTCTGWHIGRILQIFDEIVILYGAN